ncbi:MAG: hypothetical protein RI988_1753 [Pseudomonadota bacterium]|jgi:hypothetical protein
MHLIVPFASAISPGARAVLPALRLPRLAALAAQLEWGQAEDAHAAFGADRVEGDSGEVGDLALETTLTPPHERALGRALGLRAADGCWPLAAVEASRLGLPGADGAWAWLSPVHWQLGTEQVSMVDPAAIGLDEATSRAFLDSLRPIFEPEGMALYYAAPDRWLACHPDFDGLPAASVERVAGRNVDPWLPADVRARWLRRLQSEAQMLWHGHPLNEAREDRGELVVNSVWWSGCGRAGPVSWPAGLEVDARLRGPALAEDWAAWAQAWLALDAGPLAACAQRAARGEPVRVTLCGERRARTLGPALRGGLGRLADRLARLPLVGHLDVLARGTGVGRTPAEWLERL